MKFIVLEESKDTLKFTLDGENHTFCNALKAELLEVKGVQLVAYKINHPLLGVPEFVLQTKSIDPRKALKEALSNLKKKAKEFQKEVIASV